jgi:uncharacterized protein (TIGR03083 family)
MTTTAALPGIRRIEKAEAPALAGAAYDRFVELLRSLSAGDWTQPTDCTRWAVRDIAAHVLGWAETVTMRQFMRLNRLGKPVARELGGPVIDGINEVLVRQRASIPPSELIDRLAEVAPKAVAARSRVPAPLRLMPIATPEGRINLGYLNDHIFTRDLLIHRIDICRATGHELALTEGHDGRVVADVVADWADRHQRPFTLTLEGSAGGVYRRGSDGEEQRMSAVDFCRLVSGRAAGTGLLATRVPF